MSSRLIYALPSQAEPDPGRVSVAALVPRERPQLPSEILKRLNFFGFNEVNVSHFVSQPVSQNFG
jgi:hypothetical protein